MNRDIQRRLDEFRLTRATDHENELIDELVNGQIDRETFLRQGAMLGLSVGALGSVLGAFGLRPELAQAARSAPTRVGGTLRIAITKPTGSLDPVKVADLGGLGVTLIPGEQLVFADSRSVLRPVLATRWTPNRNGSVWTFTIRQGVRFHSGKTLTPADVVATFDRLTDPAVASAGASSFKGVLSKGGAQARGNTVVFELDAPTGTFPYLLSQITYQAIILPADYNGDFGETFNGTGPYKLGQNRPGQGVTFVRNEAWWGGNPPLDSVVLTYAEDEQAMVLALRGGQADLANQLSYLATRPLVSDANLQVLGVKSSNHRQLHMRNDRKPFTDRRVREAIALSLNRPSLVRALFANTGEVGNDSPMWPGYSFTDRSVPQRKQSLARARSLLRAAGVQSGTRLTLTTYRSQEMPDYAQRVQQALRPLGLNVSLKVMTGAQYFGGKQTTGPGGTPWLTVPFGIVDYGHRAVPLTFLNASLSRAGVWNAAHYRSARYDKLAKDFAAAVSAAQRKRISRQIQLLLLQDTPIVFSYFYSYLTGARKTLRGYTPDGLGVINLRGVSLA
jgi:peptide/nickel transport system substrate-binding protein